ncbi:putative transcriptional acitvator, Baf family [Thiorhodococcus drewsii AZ1]|uniref:Type III pantothenate kinase n=1 Tax=Thiorhodococcus drewsii AZ1 TaxID=765913 RepID=G2DZZ1_9GAMM|nr:putative transcriptional acitvator, Baf family [Thiorhodococcus drewsii AZ1]
MLLLDIGNTNLRWSRAAAEGVSQPEIVRHGGAVPLDLLACWETLEPPSRMLVSNVGGGGVGESLCRVARAYWGVEPEFACSRASWRGLRIAYADPGRLGVDRWLALVEAHASGARPALIVDAGTAVTFDLMLGDGRHLGGVILPGVEMMRNSLLAGTQIPRIQSEPTGEPWAADTGTAVAAGSVQAVAALTDRLFERLAVESGSDPRLLLTGGDADRIQDAIAKPCERVPDLVLRGLMRIAQNGD